MPLNDGFQCWIFEIYTDKSFCGKALLILPWQRNACFFVKVSPKSVQKPKIRHTLTKNCRILYQGVYSAKSGHSIRWIYRWSSLILLWNGNSTGVDSYRYLCEILSWKPLTVKPWIRCCHRTSSSHKDPWKNLKNINQVNITISKSSVYI